MRKFMLLLAAFLLSIGVVSSQQVQGPEFTSVAFGSYSGQDDTIAAAASHAPILVKYVGNLESGTVDLNSNAIELHSGALGSEDNAPSDSSDVNTGDVCGTTNNALDVTDTECDTAQELVEVINDSGAPWVAVLSGLHGDEVLVAADYEDPADAQAGLPGGYVIEIDNSDEDDMGLLVIPFSGVDAAVSALSELRNIEPFLFRPTAGTSVQTLKANPFEGRRTVLTRVSAVVDSTSVWDLNIYAVRYSAGGTRSERLVYTTSDTTDATNEELTFLQQAPLVSNPGETFLISVTDDALVTATISYTAYFVR